HWKAADWLTRTEREREEATSVMLKELRLKPGMVVADVGCGNGYHALPMAQSVAPGGKVIGSDIQPEMLDFLKTRAAAENITNIETVSGTLTSPELPSGKVDRILLVDAYHEFSHPPQMLAAMRDALAPGGQIVLVEFRTEDPEIPIKIDHKMSKKQVVKELNANGFKLARSFDELPWQHMLFFERAE
ncbi:MAG: class I SAM-dependent methyltransferase, partial [Kiritimatiellae bacterium]|nr:class I SAM-dependent methyltransferase [Kiritimatiellia bacterium]